MVKMFVLWCKRWTEFKNCVNWTIFSSLMSHDYMYNVRIRVNLSWSTLPKYGSQLSCITHTLQGAESFS